MKACPRITTLAGDRPHPAHGPESGLEPAVVALDSVVLVGRCCATPQEQFLYHVGQRRRPVGDHLDRVAVHSSAQR